MRWEKSAREIKLKAARASTILIMIDNINYAKTGDITVIIINIILIKIMKAQAIIIKVLVLIILSLLLLLLS